MNGFIEFDIIKKPYDNPDFCLADAIVLKACKDYYRSLIMLYETVGNIDITYAEYKNSDKSKSKLARRYIGLRNECEDFFNSDSIFLCKDGYNIGPSCIERIRKQVRTEIDNGKISFKYEA